VKIFTVFANAVPALVATKSDASETDALFAIVRSVIDVADAACEGATETKPKPNADTATSAMRLRSVFVDICFLSISRDQEFPALGFG
jgi:hypothetical protein